MYGGAEHPMNRGEAAGIGMIVSTATLILHYAILYYFVFENFLIITKTLNYDLYSVEEELWWLFIGFGFIFAIRAGTKAYKWSRRDYCNHCGKENKH